jgi:hypothetical protein
MEAPVGAIRVLDHADGAVVAQLGREIGTFNMAAVDVYDGRDLFALVRDERGALVAGLDGWTWAGTGWIVKSQDVV